VDPPRGKPPSGQDKSLPEKSVAKEPPAQREQTAQHPQPQRPPLHRIHSPPGWTSEGGLVQQQKSAVENLQHRAAENVERQKAKAPQKGGAALDAHLQKALGKPAEQGKAPELAKGGDARPLRGKVGLDAALYKALDSNAKPQQPAPGKGRGR
jgi:hypothetical protein